jgi:hypothetical protein
MTIDELRKAYRNELSRVDFSRNQDLLDPLLKQAGERVKTFFQDIQNVSTKEQVQLQRYYLKGQPTRSYSQPPFLPKGSASLIEMEVKRGMDIYEFDERLEEFNYLILPGEGNLGASLVEERTDKKNRPVNQKEIPGFIMSSGLAGKCIYLHPSHQSNAQFRYLGRDKNKSNAHVIAFFQKPEAADYLMQYSDAESSAPIRMLVQGFIWLDPDSYQIVRMRTSMLQPEKPVTLRETIADIEYGKVYFINIKTDTRQEFWLPLKIDVSWEFPLKISRLIYRNQHRYSNYRLFTVSSDYEIAPPKVKQEGSQ